MNRKFAGFTLIVALLSLGGCGYTTRSLMPDGVNNIAVDVFGNDTFYREIEFRLTREITAELNQRAPVRVTRRRNADAVLTGRIISVSRPTLVESNRNLVSEQAVIVQAMVELRSVKTGKVLVSFKRANRAEFVVERGESLETAFNEALKDLAEDIVNKLERQSFYRDLEEIRAQSSEVQSN